MRINTNIASMNAQQINSNTNKEIGSSLEKLASGHSINKASDDAAGLSIADKLRTQASSLNQGIKNANSGVAMIQMADKAMEEQSNILNTVKTKLIQASTETTTAEGRNAINEDINKLLTQLDNIASQTDYNGSTLLQSSSTDNAATSTRSFQVGEGKTETITAGATQSNTAGLGDTGTTEVSTITAANTESKVTINGVEITAAATGTTKAEQADAMKTAIDNVGINGVTVEVVVASNGDASIQVSGADSYSEGANSAAGTDITGSALSTVKGGGTLSVTDAQNRQEIVDTALTQLNEMRSELGSTQLQLESSVRNQQVTVVSLNEAESVIRDTDYAAESANFNKLNIVSQAGMYAISQANSSQQNVMKLLQ